MYVIRSGMFRLSQIMASTMSVFDGWPDDELVPIVADNRRVLTEFPFPASTPPTNSGLCSRERPEQPPGDYG